MKNVLEKILNNNSNVVISIKMKTLQEIINEWFIETIKLDVSDNLSIDYDEEIGKLMLCINDEVEDAHYEIISNFGFNFSEPFLNMDVFLSYLFNNKSSDICAYVDLNFIDDIDFDDVDINIYIPLTAYNQIVQNNKVVIEVEDGLVQLVYSNNNSEILVIDRDAEGADEDEILQEEEVINFIGNQNFAAADKYKSGVYEGNLFS